MILQSERKFIFGTKAETLEAIKKKLTLSVVPDFYFFSVEEWRKQRKDIVNKISDYFKCKIVIVRSSAADEDMVFSTMAGVYDSVPHVEIGDEENLCKAVDKVIQSYERLGNHKHYNNYVLVQEMVRDISMSGVLLTHDLNTGAPYYVINYDDESGRTDTITAGAENSNRTLLVHRGSSNQLRSERFKVLLNAVMEIEKIIGYDSLDVEFAIDKKNNVYLLQVRHIATRLNWNANIKPKVSTAIAGLQKFINESMVPKKGIFGKKTIFGKMPDWNPAEMIGTAPRPLAMSLYKYLITDGAWCKARKEMGYFKPIDDCLMVSLSGQPYIDVRLSFNSFLPDRLDSIISEKLINAWLDRLSLHKEFHDKIEFKVAITVLTFDFDKLVDENIKDVLNKDEKEIFRASLFELTNNLITGKKASIDGELKKIELLEERRKGFLKTHSPGELKTVRCLIDDCILYGTIPFSILARHAFISRSFLDSLVKSSVLHEEDVALFVRSIKTVAGSLVDDFDLFALGEISSNTFLEKYGHLRPGTYDILSKRYDQREDLIRGCIKKPKHRNAPEKFLFSQDHVAEIEKLIKSFGFEITTDRFLEYISSSIAAREYAKFMFTKSVSDALEIIGIWAESNGLNKEIISYLGIQDILNAADDHCSENSIRSLKTISDRNRREHEITLALQLPYLIEIPQDISIVPLFLNSPNFITKKSAKGGHILLKCEDDAPSNMEDHIVLIEGADPGFDWIFSRNIKGLITKFGGANSHMAIRCAEFGIPAAIGCGEQIFNRILNSREVELNCAEGRIVPIEVWLE